MEPGGFYPRSGARYLFGGRVFPGKLAAEREQAVLPAELLLLCTQGPEQEQ